MVLTNLIETHSSWDEFFTKKYDDGFNPMEELDMIFLKIGDNYFPSKENVLRFMKLDLNKIKYVIVGMEPYPSSFERNGITYPEATGRSFEVASLRGKSWGDKFKQSSLRNIVKTIYYNETNEKINLEKLREKINSKDFEISSPSMWFDNIENQGVMWLNATLTVEQYNVDTHRKYWANFMEHVIKYMCETNANLKWVLWGNQAKERVKEIVNENKMICNTHPRLVNFIDENCFQYMKNINWKC